MNNINKKPILTVYIISYNFGEYIAQAIESVLYQDTEYNFKIYIYDDCSTDGSQNILKHYQNIYPNYIDIELSDINTYSLPDGDLIGRKRLREHIKTKYVAICEGDDFWCDSHKIQKQIDYMEANQGCSMTCHASRWIDYFKNSEYDWRPYTDEKDLTPYDVIYKPNGNVSTASLIFRSEAFFLPLDYPRADVADQLWQNNALLYGNIHYFNDIMSVYRYGHESSWTSNNMKDIGNSLTHNYTFIRYLYEYDKYSRNKFHNLIIQTIDQYVNVSIESLIGYDTDKLKKQISCLQEKKFIHGLLRILNFINGEKKFSKGEIDKINNANKIYIYGHGKYSKFIETALHKIGVYDYRFVVSDNQPLSKNEVHLHDAARASADDLYIIGVSQKYKCNVEASIHKYKIDNILAPLWLKWEIGDENKTNSCYSTL